MSVSILNSRADVLRQAAAIATNAGAAKDLAQIMRTNIGPRGTIKMLVGGAGQTKLTKDGNVLLHEMHIQHSTASLIARAATAQDEHIGDGTTSTVLLISELLSICEKHIVAGAHPRVLCEGLDLAVAQAHKILDSMIIRKQITLNNFDTELLQNVARCSLRTKLPAKLADSIVPDIVEAIRIIMMIKTTPGDVLLESQVLSTAGSSDIDLFMVEVMHMRHKKASNTRLVRGLVLDHGCRHSAMPKCLRNVYVLTCNVSLEYENSEVHASFMYSDAQQRENLVVAERKYTDSKVLKIIEFKRSVCTVENGRTMIVINQKGIDPPALDMLAKEGIMALRRAKRRNMERLTLACGGRAVNCVDNLEMDDLGEAGLVYEEKLGEETYTFVEEVKTPKSCTFLINGPNDQAIAQMKDAVRDGLHAVKNVIDDAGVIPGAGAFEFQAHSALHEFKKTVSSKVRLGVEALADAFLVIPFNILRNAGQDSQEGIINALYACTKDSKYYGVNMDSTQPLLPAAVNIYDNVAVKKQLLSIGPTLVQQLILVDEIIKAGKAMGKN